jgi:hypothetical protein
MIKSLVFGLKADPQAVYSEILKRFLLRDRIFAFGEIFFQKLRF